MTRKANQKIGLMRIAASVGILIIFITGSYFFFAFKHEPYRTIPDLDLNAYMENGNSLRGNVYKIKGIIQNSLSWSPTKGRLISVLVDDGGKGRLLAVFIPSHLSKMNIQKGQQLRMKIEIIQKGFLQVLDLQKS